MTLIYILISFFIFLYNSPLVFGNDTYFFHSSDNILPNNVDKLEEPNKIQINPTQNTLIASSLTQHVTMVCANLISLTIGIIYLPMDLDTDVIIVFLVIRISYNKRFLNLTPRI
jgi:hypothetical protein